MRRSAVYLAVFLSALLASTSLARPRSNDDNRSGGDDDGVASCEGLPRHDDLRDALAASVAQIRTDGVGLGNDMWASVVDRDGVVCAVAFTGEVRSDQWPGSRVISAQKANTANAFSLEDEYPNVAGVGRALSTGNL
jgi:hypothetical protein